MYQILLRIAEVYVPSSKVAQLIARVDSRGGYGDMIRSIEQYMDDFCETCGAKGWTLEMAIEKITERWRKLEAEGGI